jgi:hypothetical protein
MTADRYPLDGIERIPDPAASITDQPAPPAAPPAEPSPTRADRQRLARGAAAAACAWVAAGVATFGVRHDIATPLVIAPLAAWSLTVALGLAVVLRPRARGLPAPVRVVQHALWVVPAVYAAGVLLVGAPISGPPVAWATLRGCMAIAHLLAIGPLAAAALLLRRSFFSASAWRGAAVGALAGLGGSLGVHAHCPVPALDHLLMAHGPSILVGAALGAFFGRAKGSV